MPVEQGALVPPPPGWPAITPQNGKSTEAHVKMAIIEWQKPSTKGNLLKNK